MIQSLSQIWRNNRSHRSCFAYLAGRLGRHLARDIGIDLL
jgi:hypothetical protein